MYLGCSRRPLILAACLVVSACSTTPTSPTSSVASGPLISQGPLAGLIPQGPPPVPNRIVGPMPSALGATRFLAFGDSITWGTMSFYDGSFLYDVPSWSYPVRLKLALDQYHPGNSGAARTYTVANAGAPGEMASGPDGGENRIQSEITANRPQGLLLLEGINDLSNGRTPLDTARAVERIVNTARANNVTVLVATMFQTYETCKPLEQGCEYRDNGKDAVVPFNQELVSRLRGRQNVYIVDLYAALGTNHVYVGADGLHPNDAGYARMASNFLAAIESVFGIRNSFQ